MFSPKNPRKLGAVASFAARPESQPTSTAGTLPPPRLVNHRLGDYAIHAPSPALRAPTAQTQPIQRGGGKRKRSDSDEEPEHQSPTKKVPDGSLGQRFYEASARSEASVRRKLMRKKKERKRIAALKKRMQASSSKPSKEKPFLEAGDSFFHLSEAVTGDDPVQPEHLKLHAMPKVYVNTRPSQDADGAQPIEPASMMVDPGGDYDALRSTEKDLSKATSGGDLVNFMLRPFNTGDYDPSKKVGPMEQVPHDERLRRDRDAVAMKFLTRAVEPIRREGEFTHSSIELLKQKEAAEPSLKPLTDEHAMMTPTSATTWHFNEAENQRQLKVFEETAKSTAEYAGAEPTLATLKTPTEKLAAAVKKKDTEKVREAQKPVVNAMLNMHNTVEDLGLGDDLAESEGEEDSWQVKRTVRGDVDPMAAGASKKKAKPKKSQEARVGKGSRQVQRADDQDHDQLLGMVRSGKLQELVSSSSQKEVAGQVNAQIKKGDKTAPGAVTYPQLQGYLHHYDIEHFWKMPKFRTDKGAGLKDLDG